MTKYNYAVVNATQKPLKMKTILIVFTKEPVTGEVKTRLGKKIGMDASKWVYEQLLQHTAQV